MKTFIEIGAADFDTMLDAHNWQGVICEPHPVFYKRLKEKCTNPNIQILDVAVSNHIGTAQMYIPTEEYINRTENNPEQYWTRGVGTLGTPGFTEKLDNAIESYGLDQTRDTAYIEVQTSTLNQIVSNMNYNRIDFLKIDTEGHDLTILENYNWRVRPTFIKCEHGKHNTPDLITDRIVNILEENGYKCWAEEWDIYAVWM